MDPSYLVLHLRDNADRVSQVEKKSLIAADITEQEVHQAVFCSGADKAPGPEGLSFRFYQTYWSEVQDAVKITQYRPCLINCSYKILTKI